MSSLRAARSDCGRFSIYLPVVSVSLSVCVCVCTKLRLVLKQFRSLLSLLDLVVSRPSRTANERSRSRGSADRPIGRTRTRFLTVPRVKNSQRNRSQRASLLCSRSSESHARHTIPNAFVRINWITKTFLFLRSALKDISSRLRVRIVVSRLFSDTFQSIILDNREGGRGRHRIARKWYGTHLLLYEQSIKVLIVAGVTLWHSMIIRDNIFSLEKVKTTVFYIAVYFATSFGLN